MSETLFVRRTPTNPNPQSQPNEAAPVAGTSNGPVVAQDMAEDGPDLEALLERIISSMYKPARDHWQRWSQEAGEMYDFVAGHQWAEEDLEILRDQSRPAITVNRIGPFVDSVSGMEINNRQETQYVPRQIGQQGVNDLLSGTAQWVRESCNAGDEETESFLDCVICGIGTTQTRLDYDDDPDGMIVIERIDPREMLWDPGARKQNLSDAQFVLRRKDLSIDAAKSLFPDVEEVDLHAQWAEDQLDDVSDPHNARLAPYYRIDQAGNIDRSRQMVRMVEVEWWDYEPAYRVLNPSTGRMIRLGELEAKLYVVRARARGIKPTVIADREKKFFKAIVGARVLKLAPGPDKGGFTYKALTGKRDRNHGTWFGIVRAMKDPQLWANKFLSQSLHIVNTNAKGGLLMESDAVEDMQEFEDSYANADSISKLNPGGLAKVQQKQPPAFPSQLNNMLSFVVAAIPQVNGVSMEMIGQSTSNGNPPAAILEQERRKQGMNVLAGLFNSKRRYQIEQGRLLLWMIQTFISDGRLIRIGGPENMAYVPLIHDPMVAEYDVIVDDAPTSPNMKERAWGALMGLFPILSRMQLPPQFLGAAMKYSPLPAALTSQLEKMTANPPPPSPVMQSKVALDTSKADLNKANAAKATAEAQTLPQKTALDLQEQEARIEHLRAQAINQMQDAGIQQNSEYYRNMVTLIDQLAGLHQQDHDQTMDHLTRMDGLAAQAPPPMGAPPPPMPPTPPPMGMSSAPPGMAATAPAGSGMGM
jgi:hypothetical protein